MTLITIKPFVSQLFVCTRPLLTGKTGLTDSCWTVYPDAFDVISLPFDLCVVFGDGLEFVIVGDTDMVGDLFELPLLGLGPDFGPINFVVESDGLSAVLPRAFDPGVLLEAVGGCAIIDFDWAI